MARTAFNYYAVGRIKSGLTRAQAQAQLNTISRQLASAYPDSNRNKQFEAVPLQEQLTGKARPLLCFCWRSVGIVLLIACVNVTQLC